MKAANELKVSDPATEAAKSSFPPASQAREEAAKGFRTQVETMLENAIRSGQTRLELNVTEVSGSFVSALKQELEAGGYVVKLSNQSSGAQNFQILKVTF